MSPLPAAHAEVPPWVRWVAQDANGAWWGFEHEPNEGATSWYENEVGRYRRLAVAAPNPRWSATLSRWPDGADTPRDGASRVD